MGIFAFIVLCLFTALNLINTGISAADENGIGMIVSFLESVAFAICATYVFGTL